MTQHRRDPSVAHVAVPAGCASHPVAVTPEGVVWGWEGPIPGAEVRRWVSVFGDPFVAASPDADEVVVSMRDVLIAEPYGYSNKVLEPERLKGRNGEPVFVFHEGVLREAVVDVHILKPCVGVSWEDTDAGSWHVRVREGWGEVVEAYLGFKRATADKLPLAVPASEGGRSVDELVMAGPNRPHEVLRALRECVEAAGYESLWHLMGDGLAGWAQSFGEEVVRFAAGGHR